MKKAGKWHYRVKSWVIFNKGQFTYICQLNVSCGQDSVSGIVHTLLRMLLSSNSAVLINIITGVIIIILIPPPPGGTAILPEYIHYYG
jgi:hypothetical protein